MDLDKTTQEIIKGDSVPRLRPKEFGQSVVAISFGSAGQAELTDGETIQSQSPLIMATCSKRRTGSWIAVTGHHQRD